MAIRFKKVLQCTDITSKSEERTICNEVEIPIREWGFSPEILNIRWVEGTPMPNSQLITIVFPELENLVEYTQLHIQNVTYRIENTTNSDFVTFHWQDNPSEIAVKNDGKVQFRVSFRNFNQLAENKTRIELQCQVFGTLTEAGVTYSKKLEERKYIIQIEKITDHNAPYLTTHKNEYFVTYIKSTGELLGDTLIGVHVHNLPTYSGFFGLWSHFPLFGETHEAVRNDTFKEVPILPASTWSRLSVGDMSLRTFVILYHNQGRNLRAEIIVHLSIKENREGFDVDKNSFDFELFHHQNQSASGSFNIINHSNLPLEFEKSDWISLTHSGNTVSFVTQTAQELNVGVRQGFIKIRSGNFFKIVSVRVVVEKTIVSNLQDVNFCLDSQSIIVQKAHAEATFLKMKLRMQMVGYDLKEKVIEQTYQYVFFNNQVTLYPGEEIQDFFEQMPSLEPLYIAQNDIIMGKNLFKACLTQISITQYNSNTIYKEEIIGDFYFLPGKKPQAYPFLTNGKTRRTYTDSLLCICALQEDFLGRELGQIAGNMVDNSQINLSKYVVNINFRRWIADRTYGAMQIIRKEALELHPIPNPSETIDVIFMNQNHCPDWFTFSGEWQLQEDLTQTLSENIQNGKQFKAYTQRKETLTINTGWILQEEVSLLTELMLSPLCFAHIQGQWVALIPISKKALTYNWQDNIRSFVVEFQYQTPNL